MENQDDIKRLQHLQYLIANSLEDFEEYQEAVYLRNKIEQPKEQSDE